MGLASSMFGGPRLVFWSVAPAALAAGIVLLLGFEKYTLPQKLFVIGLEVMLVLVAAMLLEPMRYRGAARLLAAAVALLYVVYYLEVTFPGARMFSSPGPVPDSESGLALRGLLLIGLPCAIYAMRGTLGLRARVDEPVEAPQSDAPAVTDASKRAA